MIDQCFHNGQSVKVRTVRLRHVRFHQRTGLGCIVRPVGERVSTQRWFVGSLLSRLTRLRHYSAYAFLGWKLRAYHTRGAGGSREWCKIGKIVWRASGSGRGRGYSAWIGGGRRWWSGSGRQGDDATCCYMYAVQFLSPWKWVVVCAAVRRPANVLQDLVGCWVRTPPWLQEIAVFTLV